VFLGSGAGPCGVVYDSGMDEIFATTGGLNTVVVISDSAIPEFPAAILLVFMLSTVSVLVLILSRERKVARSTKSNFGEIFSKLLVEFIRFS
jgi:hypothetical protein